MVGVARALMSNPDLLLLDEPSLGLAPIVVGEMFDALARIRDEGMGILLVEQNLKFARSVADRHVVVENGRVIDTLSNDALKADMARVKSYVGV